MILLPLFFTKASGLIKGIYTDFVRFVILILAIIF